MTTDGVVKAAGFRRMNEESRWNVGSWNALRGLAPRPRRRHAARADFRKYGVPMRVLTLLFTG